MECEHEGHAVAELYGARGAPSWGDWNSTSGGQGYWLLGTSALLVIVGIVMMTSKPHQGGAGYGGY